MMSQGKTFKSCKLTFEVSFHYAPHKAKICITRSNVLRHDFHLPKVIRQVQSGNEVLNRLVPCIKRIELAS